MTVEIKAPAFPESVADGVVSAWHKGSGDSVARDELLVEIETDKVVMEVVAPEPGVIEAIMVAEGETITSEADISSTIFADNFLVFNIIKNDGFYNVRYQIKPFMIWIWISVILISLGGILSLKKKNV